MTTKISKGSLVRLNAAVCFTTTNGGMRKYPMTNSFNDDRGTVEGIRVPTQEEIEAWYDSDASKGIDCAGETKLPPTAYAVAIHKDQVYTVVRARCAGHWSYRRHPGQALILDTKTGHEIYVKRDLLEVAA
tara:strand:+ start:265 stop:657 length:393 start_codon:yes stop_codon:yes gene_type:complete